MAFTGKRTLIIALGIIAISLTLIVNSSQAEVAVIKVDHRNASDIFPLVESLLSPGGKSASIYGPIPSSSMTQANP